LKSQLKGKINQKIEDNATWLKLKFLIHICFRRFSDKTIDAICVYGTAQLLEPCVIETTNRIGVSEMLKISTIERSNYLRSELEIKHSRITETKWHFQR
jgi:hypothetical protein